MDGRYHTICRHFVSMSTRVQDCLQPNCLFSQRHIHVTGLSSNGITLTSPQSWLWFSGCRSPLCTRLMALPVKNPIRISPTKCGDCVTRDREGTLGLSLESWDGWRRRDVSRLVTLRHALPGYLVLVLSCSSLHSTLDFLLFSSLQGIPLAYKHT